MNEYCYENEESYYNYQNKNYKHELQDANGDYCGDDVPGYRVNTLWRSFLM
jgi:hypothetical protein